jgi:hypothetical protein
MLCNKTNHKKYGRENKLLYSKLVLFFAVLVAV